MKRVTVGLLWHNFFSGNLGVSALSYAHAKLIKEVLNEKNKKVTFYVFGHGGDISEESIERIQEFYECEIVHLKYGAREILKLDKRVFFALKNCDYVFDIGEGDSFSDIYGFKRFANQFISKLVAKLVSGKLVLAPQTYGPFNGSFTRLLARFISRYADQIYSRDELSKRHYQPLSDKNIKSFTDVAFALPFELSKKHTMKPRVGINVSGLLYSKSDINKGIDLGLNYKKFTHDLVDYFIKEGADIELVAHVSGNLDAEDDYKAGLAVQKTFPSVKVSHIFDSPIDAKSYISGFDFFVGARMHATIAALSSGVAVSPVAYSMKFKGVFSALNYDWVVEPDASKSQGEIFKQVIHHYSIREQLRGDAVKSIEISKYKIEAYKQELRLLFDD